MASPVAHITKRDLYAQQISALKQERTTFDPVWKELGQYIKPMRPRFTSTERNRGTRRNQKIIDSTATFAARTLSAGLVSNVSSPSRPWFDLTISSYAIGERTNVKLWLDEVRDLMLDTLGKSNFYQTLPTLYGDMAVFATGAMIMEEDDESIVRFLAFPIGEYYLAIDSKGRVRGFAREFQLSIRQIVEKFGYPNGPAKDPDLSVFSQSVRDAWTRKMLDTPIDVVHLIQENAEYSEFMLAAKYKRYSDCYYEAGSRTPAFLREGGFDDFPVLAARWETAAGDIYGTDCPGMTALGDIKQLQFGEKQSARGLELMVNPPTVAPSSMINKPLSTLPGDVSFEEPNQPGNNGFRPLFQTNLRIDLLEQKQQQIRGRIDEAFYVDLILMLDRLDQRDRTATEIIERKEEKLLALGPMYEGLNQGVFDPMIDRLFNILLKRGMIPTPPQEMEGMAVSVKYTSVMAQAQKSIGRSGMDATVLFVNALANNDPNSPVYDKLDKDEMVDEYSAMCGNPTRVIVADEDVARIRAERAKAIQAQQQAETLAKAAQGAKTLSETNTTDPNALTDILSSAGAAA